MSEIQLMEKDDISIEQEMTIRDGPDTRVSEVDVLASCGEACVTFEGAGMPEDLEQRVAESVDKRRRGIVATVWWQTETGRAVIAHEPVDW